MRQPVPSLKWSPATLVGQQRVIAHLHLKVVTPMFGGSEVARGSDDRQPVRAASVRGHLRFWWRACNARSADLHSVAELFEQEAVFWGAAASKTHPDSGNAAIEIEVTTFRHGALSFFAHDSSDLRPNRRGWHRGLADDPNGNFPRGPARALFPFQKTTNRDEGGVQDAAVGREGVEFHLRVTLASHVTDQTKIDAVVHAVRQALWAWITFGGVGSRTRRGCGTLWCAGDATAEASDLPAQTFQLDEINLQEWMTENFRDLVVSGSNCDLVPSLHGARLQMGSEERHAIDAWRDAVEPLQSFRQGERIGRNPKTHKRPGQSRWPEPGAIRELLDLPANRIDDEGHEYTRTKGADGRDFPRADLGLPILFQKMHGASATPTLQGAAKGATRLASPIVVKALPISANRFMPIALLLNAPHVWSEHAPGVEFKGETVAVEPTPLNAPPPHWPFSDGLVPADDLPPQHHPPRVLGAYSARDAFMDYLRLDRHWKKVT